MRAYIEGRHAPRKAGLRSQVDGKNFRTDERDPLEESYDMIPQDEYRDSTLSVDPRDRQFAKGLEPSTGQDFETGRSCGRKNRASWSRVVY
jgi:hypothetical protein